MRDCGSIKYIECHGNPYEMGYQYGMQAKQEIAKMFKSDSYKWILSKSAKAKTYVRKLEDNIAKLLPELHEELKGIADGSGQDSYAIMLLNHYPLPDDTHGRCTPIGLVSRDEGVLISKNNDGNPGDKEKHPFVIRRSVPDKGFGLPMIQVTYAGWLSGLDAMNTAGLANVHASVGSVFPRNPCDIDIGLVAYHAMRRSENAKDFKAVLWSFPLSGKGFNILIGDASGWASVIEAAVPLLLERDCNKKFLYATNHYTVECIRNSDGRTPKGKEISTYRLGYLKWVEETNPPENMKDLKNLLSSHDPWAPCGHGGPRIMETLWSIIFNSNTKSVFLADNTPCTNKYARYDLKTADKTRPPA
ncbi:MAG: C45 family peptidase [Victivallales bacterium]|jgi:hypothetical protein